MWLCGPRELSPVNVPRCEGHPAGLGSSPLGGMSPALKDSHPRETLCPRGGHRARGKLAAAPRGRGRAPAGTAAGGGRGEAVRGERSLRGGQPDSVTLQRSEEHSQRAGEERAEPPPRRGAPGSASSQSQPPPVSGRGAPHPPRRRLPGRGASTGSDPGVAARTSPRASASAARSAEGQRSRAG